MSNFPMQCEEPISRILSVFPSQSVDDYVLSGDERFADGATGLIIRGVFLARSDVEIDLWKVVICGKPYGFITTATDGTGFWAPSESKARYLLGRTYGQAAGSVQ